MLTVEDDPDHPPEKVVRLVSMRQPAIDPPLRLSILVGEVLFNLRSALDQLIWALAVIGTGPGERNQFPIFDTPEKFKEFRERYLHGVRSEHRAAIEAYQPYKGMLDGHYLRALASLNDIDKHRVVHASSQFALTGPASLSLPGITTAQIRGSDWTRLKDGAEVYRILSWEPTDAKVEVEADLRYTILFGEPEKIALSRLDLANLRDIVSNIVEAFAPEFVGQPGA